MADAWYNAPGLYAAWWALVLGIAVAVWVSNWRDRR
jgi:hypothetical protein